MQLSKYDSEPIKKLVFEHVANNNHVFTRIASYQKVVVQAESETILSNWHHSQYLNYYLNYALLLPPLLRVGAGGGIRHFVRVCTKSNVQAVLTP